MTSTSDKKPLPLLSENQENGPLLGGSSAVEQSPLEQLILQSTSEQAAASSVPFFIDENDDVEGANAMVEVEAPQSLSPEKVHQITKTTLIAGTFCLLHVCLVWASFFSNAWFDTHLMITVGTGTPFEFSTDQVLQRTTLASLLSLLMNANQQWPAMFLVLTCLIFPCLCMILCISWTYGDYQEALKVVPRRLQLASHVDLLGFDPRILAEQILIRVGFLAFFLLAILDIGTSSLALDDHNDSVFLVTNRSLGGLACYVLGITCAMGVVVVLRFASQKPFRSRDPQQESIQAPPAPPDQAFEDLRRPLLQDEEEAGGFVAEVPQNVTGDPSTTRLAKWKRIIAYEFGVLAVILWLPAFFLPLFRLSFDGLVASFMDEGSYEIAFYQIPTTLLQRADAAETKQWILMALGVVLLGLVYVIPIVATVLAVQAWRSPEYSKDVWFYNAILRHLQPCLCGVVFSVALICAIPTFSPLVEGILDTQTAGFCQQFSSITDTACLVVEGRPRLGHWFLLAQAVSLEIFVSLTLRWKR